MTQKNKEMNHFQEEEAVHLRDESNLVGIEMKSISHYQNVLNYNLHYFQLENEQKEDSHMDYGHVRYIL